MSPALRLLSVLSRLAMPAGCMISCRSASRGSSKAAQSRAPHRATALTEHMSDDELGLEGLDEVEGKLQALVEEHDRRRKTVKYHILRRKMTPSGAPERKLTWDAIEQIRYLKQEQPDEWTVERLAEGYSVTPDVILRVLRSKFVPAPDRKMKQNAKVMAGLGQQVLPSGTENRPKLPGNSTTAPLLPGGGGGGGGAVVPVAERLALMRRGEDSRSLAAPVALVPAHSRGLISKDFPEEEDNSTCNPESTEDSEDEEIWDGRLLTDEELEEFMGMADPHPVVQVGKDFFDADGNFLYRI